MELTVGQIVEGTVKSLTKFGAFIILPDGSTGMVHISEVAHTYVTDIHDHLKEGDVVKVMVISMENGKINLSIKRTVEPPQGQMRRNPGGMNRQPSGNFADKRPQPSRDGDHAGSYAPKSDRRPPRSYENTYNPRPAESNQPKSFDDMLKQFMSESDSKMSTIKQYSDHKTKTRRR